MKFSVTHSPVNRDLTQLWSVYTFNVAAVLLNKNELHISKHSSISVETYELKSNIKSL